MRYMQNSCIIASLCRISPIVSALFEELVERKFISTQAEISDYLQSQGIYVTQATISRDVSELRLVRIPAGDGRTRYRGAPLAQRKGGHLRRVAPAF
ncbi:MAG: hypothetical protein R2865_03645 [Deinococcales bacterium]